MLQASKAYLAKELKTRGSDYLPEDIIITKTKIEENVIDKNTIEYKRVEYEVNLTRKVNESAKLIKQNQAIEKLKELEQIFTK